MTSPGLASGHRLRRGQAGVSIGRVDDLNAALAKYEHLWTRESDEWVLLRFADTDSYLPYHVSTKSVMIIEGEDEMRAVAE